MANLIVRGGTPTERARRVFVVGAEGMIGQAVINALTGYGAAVTALIPPGCEVQLPAGVGIATGDVWNPPSLKGLARGHGVILHLIRHTRDNPARGRTFYFLHVTSIRNIIHLALSAGVGHMIMLSTAGVLCGARRPFVESLRLGEHYLMQSGLAWAVARMPRLLEPNDEIDSALSSLGQLPLIGSLLGRYVPIPLPELADGLARLALNPGARHKIYYAPALRKLPL